MRCSLFVALAPVALACSFDATGNGLAPTSDTGEATTAMSTTTTGDPPVPTSTEGGESEAMTSAPTGLPTTEPVEPVTSASSSEGGESSSSSEPQPAGCGDGIVDGGEACDDGNDDETDECTSECQEAVCGDGHVWQGEEECDDGNDDETDTCTSDCAAPSCGDGAKNGKETDVDCGGDCKPCGLGQGCATDLQCTTNVCDAKVCRYAKSCKALKSKGQPTGKYTIDPDDGEAVQPFEVWCEQDYMGGGWTLVLKADGSTTNFEYANPKWTDPQAWEPHPDLERSETKLRSFSTVPLMEVLVGMEAPKAANGALQLKYIQFNVAASSLFELSNKAEATPVTNPFSHWQALITDPGLQPHCRRQGFNVQSDSPNTQSRARIGIIGNDNTDANECVTHNSFIGVGGSGNSCGGYSTTTGNGAACNGGGPGGNKDTKGFAAVFVR